MVQSGESCLIIFHITGYIANCMPLAININFGQSTVTYLSTALDIASYCIVLTNNILLYDSSYTLTSMPKALLL